LVAASTRMSTFSGFESPTLVTTRSCSARRSFTWSDSGSSPISSRKSVPLSAAWNFPARVATAPVKAPFTCPKSSDSMRFSGMAPQLMTMKGPLARLERLWISRAMSSLPVPVSPVMSTDTSVGATFCTLLNTFIIESQLPMISPKRCSLSFFSSSALPWRRVSSSSAPCRMSEACDANTDRMSSERGSNTFAIRSLPR
jgi:hypothetical protein